MRQGWHSLLQLVESEYSVTAGVKAGVIGTWDWHIRENKVFANERFARTFGVDPAAAAMGAPLEDFIAGIHPEDRVAVRQQIVAAVATGGLYAEEYRVIGDDNRVRWVLARGRCIQDELGRPVRFPGAITDVTERREREQTDRVLAAELHHRFRNLLGMIQTMALASLQDDVPMAVARESFMQRLSATSGALNALADQSRRTTDLRALVVTAISAVSDLKCFSISGDRLSVGPEQSLALALALHELTTNAIKYGSLSSLGGSVELAWSVGRDDGLFSMVWQERDGPPVREPGHTGFGSFLIVRNVEAELGGEVVVAFLATGLMWTVTAPVARLLPKSRTSS